MKYLILLLIFTQTSFARPINSNGCHGVPNSLAQKDKTAGIIYLEQNNFTSLSDAIRASRKESPKIIITVYDTCYVFVNNPSAEYLAAQNDTSTKPQDDPVPECIKDSVTGICKGWEISAGRAGNGVRALQSWAHSKENIGQALDSAKANNVEVSWGDLQRHYYDLTSPASSFAQQANNLSNSLLNCVADTDPNCLDAPTEGEMFLKNNMFKDADTAIRTAYQQGKYLGSGDMKGFYTPAGIGELSEYEKLKASSGGGGGGGLGDPVLPGASGTNHDSEFIAPR